MNRREFVKLLSTGALSTAFLSANVQNLLAQGVTGVGESLVWLKGHCSDTHHIGQFGVPDLAGFLSHYFHRPSTQDLQSTRSANPSILIIEGSFSDVSLEQSHQLLLYWAQKAKVIVLLGNEAAYPAERPDGYLDVVREVTSNIPAPVIRLPGQPAQPRHILGLLNHLLMYGLPDLDEYRRPTLFFDQLICDQCEHRGDFESGDFVSFFGEKAGCLYLLGCKGRVTYNDCGNQKWNQNANWCVGAGSPCTGCSEPAYPSHLGLGVYGQLSHRVAGVKSGWIRHAEQLAYGTFGVTLGGVGLHAFAKRSMKRFQIEDIEDEG